MGSAPVRKKSSSSTGTKQGGRRKAPAVLRKTLAAEVAPWRPFKEEGVLLKARKSARDATAIFVACERQLLAHLSAVCLWPSDERNESWRIGDYSFYILDFEPAPKTRVHVQFWSEPDSDGVLFEVVPPAPRRGQEAAAASTHRLLRERGFEIGGNKRHFGKTVRVTGARDVRAIAREAVAILSKVLGFDGTRELTYTLSLDTESDVRHVLMQIEPEDLAKLLREWGFPAELNAREDGAPPLIHSRTETAPFGVLLSDEAAEGADSYLSLGLRAYHTLPPGTDEQAEAARLRIVNELNHTFPLLQASVDEDGDLALDSSILLHGGVTAEHVRARLELWRAMLRAMGEGMQ